MQALFGVDAALPYAARCQALLNAGVALWGCDRLSVSGLGVWTVPLSATV